MRKATAFRGGANKTAPPCETLVVNNPLQLFRGNSCNGDALQKILLLEKPDFQRPAKGGSTPAFACQRAAIAPLPYSNLQP